MNFNEAVIEGAAPRALTDSKDKVLELKLWARPPRFQREPTTRIRCWERARVHAPSTLCPIFKNFEFSILSQPFSICCSTSFCTVSAGANHVDANQLGRPIRRLQKTRFQRSVRTYAEKSQKTQKTRTSRDNLVLKLWARPPRFC